MFTVQLQGILKISLETEQEECLYEEINAGTKVSGSFQVSSGGFLDIDVKVQKHITCDPETSTLLDPCFE
jgi:hypothetical protein